MVDKYASISLLLFFTAAILVPVRGVWAGTLTCSVTTAAACQSPSVIGMRFSGATNAHAELPAQSTAAYANSVVCCSGVAGLANTCTGTNATLAKLTATTNSHIEQNTQANYGTNACLSVPAGGTVTVTYQAGNCTGQDTTLGSLQAATNAHAGDTTAYTTKICGTAAASGPSLSFAISDTAIGYGPLSSSAARFASGDGLGSGTEVGAHTLTASTNSGSGYTITVQGATLTSTPYTISAIGGSNTGSVAGIEQFGVRATAAGGIGTVTAPYAAAGFAYAANTSTPSQIATATSGNGVDTVYSMRYLANVAPTTEAGNYSANLVYVITANF